MIDKGWPKGTPKGKEETEAKKGGKKGAERLGTAECAWPVLGSGTVPPYRPYKAKPNTAGAPRRGAPY